ncbi:MAG TPA: energy transducer TonB [Vitreimonas sp.]|nr:energy transducer TonB [Vitreimonas sp.]
MRFLRVLLLPLVLVASPAAAQTAPDPILQHYRDYRAALDRQDWAAAEAAAELALSASEARDGDGGRTAVLALNLATTRLTANDAAGALAPAQRAFSLAEAGAPGVDPTVAALALGRAELATSGQAGADRLAALLADEGALANVGVEEIYPSAAMLGVWALQQHQHQRARESWSVAARHAAGSPYGEEYGLATARLWEGAAIIMDELGGGQRRMNVDNATEAYIMLAEAYTLLRPMALVEPANLELTVAQNTYANVLAWLGAVRAKMRADGQRLPRWPGEAQGDADGMSEIGAPTDITLPRCLLDLEARPLPRFPAEELRHMHLGVVVVRLQFDDAGNVVQHRVVARAGSEGFQRAVERVADRWSVTRDADSPSQCRMPRTLLTPVSFQLN